MELAGKGLPSYEKKVAPVCDVLEDGILSSTHNN